MDIKDVIKTRRSIRAFLPRPVPQEILQEILEYAFRSPSWANSQMWEVAMLGGDVLLEIKRALVSAHKSNLQSDSDIPWPEFPEPYRGRRRELGVKLYEALGINRDDTKARDEWTVHGLNFLGAPNGIIIYKERELNEWAILDTGIIMQTIMLLAPNYGLGTCAQAAVVRYPNIIRGILNLPPNKFIVCGMAIGYPDWSHPANKFVSPRGKLEDFVTWYGF